MRPAPNVPHPHPSRRHLPLAIVLMLAASGCSDPATDTAASPAATASAGNAAQPAAVIPASARDPALGTVPAGAVVVRVSGTAASRYPVGTSLAADSSISLADGESLVLLSGDGTRTLAGPGTFTTGSTSQTSGRGDTLGRVATSIASNDSRSAVAAGRMPPRPVDGGNGAIDTAARYAAALFDADSRTATAATRRGTPPPTTLAPHLAALPEGPGLWAYALGSSGSHCLPALNDLMLVRRGGGDALTVTVTAREGATRTVAIGQGRSGAGWTGAWLSPATRYRIAVAGGPGGDVRFVPIGNPPADPAALARLLATHGCTAQVQRLARMMGASGLARDDLSIPRGAPVDRPRDTGPVAVTPDRPTATDPAPPAPESRPGPRGGGVVPVDIRPRPDMRPGPRADSAPEARAPLPTDLALPPRPPRVPPPAEVRVRRSADQ